MTKGKPWPSEDEKKLREWVTSRIGLNVIVFSFDGKYSKNAVQQKMLDLGLKLEEEEETISGKKVISSSKLEIPKELPTIEETLKLLGAALLKSAEEGLSKDEVQRLQVVSNLAKAYKEAFADYANYLGIEERLAELEAKQDVPVKKT